MPDGEAGVGAAGAAVGDGGGVGSVETGDGGRATEVGVTAGVVQVEAGAAGAGRGRNEGSPHTVTVIIVNWNQPTLTQAALDSIAGQVTRVPISVVLVDNGSTDGSGERLAADNPGVTVVRRAVNGGFGAGVNAGLAVTDTDLVVLLNNDAVAEPDFVQNLVDALDAAGDDVAAVTGRILLSGTWERETPGRVPEASRSTGGGDEDNDADIGGGVGDDATKARAAVGVEGEDWDARAGDAVGSGTGQGFGGAAGGMAGETSSGGHTGSRRRLEAADGTVWVSSGTGRILTNSTGNIIDASGNGQDRSWLVPHKADAASEVFGFSGGAVLLRRSALESVGQFDESLFMYYEDTELSWRMRRAGWRVIFAGDAVVHHRHAGSSSVHSELFIRFNTRNRLAVALLHGPWRMLGSALWHTFGRLVRVGALTGLAELGGLRWRGRPGGRRAGVPDDRVQGRPAGHGLVGDDPVVSGSAGGELVEGDSGGGDSGERGPVEGDSAEGDSAELSAIARGLATFLADTPRLLARRRVLDAAATVPRSQILEGLKRWS